MSNEFGWEGVAALASSFTQMNLLNIDYNSQVLQGSKWLGKLPNLTIVSTGTSEVTEFKPDVQVGLEWYWPTSFGR